MSGAGRRFIVITGLSGAGKTVALANKESLVAGGDLVAAARHRSGAGLVPVDSEHSALFQLLEGVERPRMRIQHPGREAIPVAA